MKKLILALFLMAAIFGATFAAWRYGVVTRAWRTATGLVSAVAGRESAAESAEAESTAQSHLAAASEPDQPRTRQEMLSAMAAPRQASDSLRPATTAPATSSLRPTTNASEPIDVAVQSSPVAVSAAPNRSFMPPISGEVAVPVDQPRLQTRPSPQQQLQAQVMANAAAARETPVATEAAVSAPVERSIPGVDAAAAPILSDFRAQIKVIDQLLASDPAEAMRRVDDVLALSLKDDEAAEAGYRKGYAARMLRDEATAERVWRETAEAHPAQRGGRYSALALGDTLYHKYAGERPQPSYWDDISIMYSRALGKDDAPFLPAAARDAIKQKLNRINDSILFGSGPTTLARYHKVEAGELLGSIAGKYRVDYESISRVNGINPNRISIGMDLKVVVGDVEVIVRKNSADRTKGPTVTWFLDGRWAREYPACVGEGVKTPPGTYNFTSKERDPSWTNPVNGQLLPNNHPENILGSRWMAMKGMNTQGLGIHGTTVDDSVPGYTSAGCVRLLDKDVEELFSYARINGRVTVLD